MAQQPQNHICYRDVDQLKKKIAALEARPRNNPRITALKQDNRRLKNEVSCIETFKGQSI